MYKSLRGILALALCAALLCVPAFGAETEETQPARPAPVRVWGTAAWEGEALHLQNSDANDPYGDVVVHLSEATALVDAVTGLPLERSAIRDGDTVYAWVGPAMTMSLPPQASATVVVANIPADFAVPQYAEVASVEPYCTIAIYPAPPLTQITLRTTGGGQVSITDQAELRPYLTKNAVTLEALVPGTRMLVWTGMDGVVTRVVVFPYDYQGYLEVDELGGVRLDGGPVEAAARRPYGDQRCYVPIRAVAEAMGGKVTWDAQRGVVVSTANGTQFSIRPDTAEALVGEDARTLAGSCLIAAGVTYLEAGDLAALLNLFWAG